MTDKSALKNVIIFASITIIFSLLYVIIDRLTTKKVEEYDEYLKNYEINEYIPTYVSDQDMAKIYLSDYIQSMYFDIEGAYNLLDEEYRVKKFGDITGYTSYVKALSYNAYEVDKYYVDTSDGYKIFGVYDKNGNIFIFKTNGVMQYKVYLDDSTVEI